jgi:hypothetical protein
MSGPTALSGPRLTQPRPAYPPRQQAGPAYGPIAVLPWARVLDVRQGEPGNDPRRRARRVRRLAVLVGIVVAVALAVDLVWAATTALPAFRDTHTALRSAGGLLLAGDVDAAEAGFSHALSRADRAASALSHPSVGLLGLLPRLDDDVDAARRAARASQLAAEGGLSYVSAARGIGWDGEQVPGFSGNGRFDADAIATAAPDVARAAELLAEADGELTTVDADRLAGPLGTLMRDAKEEIGARADQAETAATLAGVLPRFLGAEGPRTYLLVTLTPSDPRGSGGYPGVYGLLRADGRRLELDELRPIATIPQVAPVDAPDDVRRRYGPYGALRTFWATTYTPDFPTAASLMRAIWERGGGEPIDGVIAGDPAFMAGVLAAVGPVETGVWPEPITSDNVEQILGADLYRTDSSAESDAWQVAIGDALWQAILQRPWPAQPMASALAGAADDRHLQIFAVDPEEQASFRDVGVTGDVRFADDDPPLVTLNGFTANRAGYFATTEVTSTSEERDDGSRDVTVTVTITNDAPSGPPSILLGLSQQDTGGEPLGTFGTDVNVYLPEGARPLATSVDGRREPPFVQQEFGRPVVSPYTFVPPGGTSVVTVTYRVES